MQARAELFALGFYFVTVSAEKLEFLRLLLYRKIQSVPHHARFSLDASLATNVVELQSVDIGTAHRSVRVSPSTFRIFASSIDLDFAIGVAKPMTE